MPEGAASGGPTMGTDESAAAGTSAIQSNNHFSGDRSMSKMTLDLNGLNVESFAAQDPAFEQGAVTTHLSLTDRVCCEGAGVEACTVKEPCCVVTP
jgi:hypothetical protein